MKTFLARLRVLGEVEVWAGGDRVEVGHARRRCVLAALAVDANHVVTTEQLLDRVWGEHPPHRARQVISNYVSRLRRVLTAGDASSDEVVIQRRGGGYVLLVDPDDVDLHLFRRLVGRARAETDELRALELLEQAGELWRGEPFAGLDTLWITMVREGLEHERFAADGDRFDLALRLGRHDALLPELTARAAAHPLNERLAAQLMLALYRSGRQAEALAEFQRARTRLADELGTDPGPALRELHQRILTADSALTTPGIGAEVASGVPTPRQLPVPRQLPAPPRAFTGRVAELARLDHASNSAPGGDDPHHPAPSTPAATGATIVISAIAGAGGMGKTWLALNWAHRNAHRFPDGQLFVDLRGFSPDSTPMPPGVAVRGFLDALGVDSDRLPIDPHARAALFRSTVADRRMLIVLDNAVDTAQVAPLLPGGDSCTVLVTSRDRLPGLVVGHGAHHVALDALDDAEGRGLLTTRLGTARIEAEPAAVDELIRLCGGFPLALSIIAGRAHTHPHLPLATIAAELRDSGLDALDDPDPAASLPTVLSSSYRALTGEQAEVFGLLAIAPGADIGLAAAACLTGLPPARARIVLRGLEQASLISCDAHGRYRVHDLIRRYAADTARHLSDDVRQAALRRVLDHYTHTAHAADRLLEPRRKPIRIDPTAPGARPHPLPDTRAALAWFDTEHANLLAAQHAATTHALHRTAWQLAWTLDTFHTHRGHRHDYHAVWRAALDAAAHLPDPTPRILAHRLLGVAHADLGHHDEATGHLHQALALAEHHRDVTDQANTHQALAWAQGRWGDDRRALEHAARAVELYRALDQPAREADALNQVGWHAARLGDHDRARAHCQAALALYHDHANPTGEANTLDSLGFIDHHTGHHRRAVRHYRQALARYRELGNTSQAAHTLDRLGHPHAALGQHEQANAVWQEALDLYRQLGRDEDVRRVRRQFGFLDEPVGEQPSESPKPRKADPDSASRVVDPAPDPALRLARH